MALAADLRAGKLPPKTADGVLAAAAIRVVVEHMNTGRPLRFPVIVAEAYLAAGENIEFPLFDCEQCGYLLPRSFSRCPLCNGRVGLSLYSKRSAAIAAWN